MIADELRVGVVGCGFQGRLHVECLQRIPGARVVAVCDRDLRRAAALAAEHSIAGVHGDHLELLARGGLDLVTVCTMPDTHRAIAIDAVEAGVHVLCEKPLALDLADARAMVAAARRARRTLAVGFNLRYSRAAQAVRSFVDDGRLGTPVCARASMLETVIPWWGPHQRRAISGGGALASTAVHVLDLAMWLAGNPEPRTATASAARLFPGKRGATAPDPRRTATYDVEDLLVGHVRFANGFWLSVEGSWVWDQPGWDCRLTLVGEAAHAELDPLGLWHEVDGRLVDAAAATAGGVDVPGSVQRELEDVVDRLRSGRPPLASGEQALQVAAVVDALYRSAELGREVEVEPTSPLDTAEARR